MPTDPNDDRILRKLRNFDQKLQEAHGPQFEAVASCLQLAAKAMRLKPSNDLQRLTRLFLASMTNSLVGVLVLCKHGHGADSIRVTRGMLDVLINLKYLIKRSSEVRDFLEFDSILRWHRLQFFKSHHPEMYAGFSETKKAMVEKDYIRLRHRFIGANNKTRPNWCKHSIAQMAEIAGLKDIYDVAYFHASALHHGNPMGLTMEAHPDTRDIRPVPKLTHIGIALLGVVTVMAEGIRSYASLHGIDYEETLSSAEQKDEKVPDINEDEVVGSLAELFPG
jgi:hypothetical protein